MNLKIDDKVPLTDMHAQNAPQGFWQSLITRNKSDAVQSTESPFLASSLSEAQNELMIAKKELRRCRNQQKESAQNYVSIARGGIAASVAAGVLLLAHSKKPPPR
jgi:hypothetical protein